MDTGCKIPECRGRGNNKYRGENGNSIQVCDKHYAMLVAGESIPELSGNVSSMGLSNILQDIPYLDVDSTNSNRDTPSLPTFSDMLDKATSSLSQDIQIDHRGDNVGIDGIKSGNSNISLDELFDDMTRDYDEEDQEE